MMSLCICIYMSFICHSCVHSFVRSYVVFIHVFMHLLHSFVVLGSSFCFSNKPSTVLTAVVTMPPKPYPKKPPGKFRAPESLSERKPWTLVTHLKHIHMRVLGYLLKQIMMRYRDLMCRVWVWLQPWPRVKRARVWRRDMWLEMGAAHKCFNVAENLQWKKNKNSLWCYGSAKIIN